MTEAEALALADELRRAKAGDKAAVRSVLGQMAPLVRIIAGDWKRHADREDLIQEGTIAVWEAIKNWDPDHPSDVNFTAFCRIHIRGAISRRAANDVSVVKLNRAEQEAFRGRDAAAREARAHRLCGDVSVDAPTRGTDQPAPSMVTALPSAGLDPEALLSQAQDQHRAQGTLTELLERLPATEAIVLKARYLTDPPVDTAVLAQRLQCHKEQVRQAGLRALTHLGRMLGAPTPLSYVLGLLKRSEGQEATPPMPRFRPWIQHAFPFAPERSRRSCLFCPRLAILGRKVCRVHHWRVSVRCKGCQGRVRYRDSGGRQYSLCDRCCPGRRRKTRARRAQSNPPRHSLSGPDDSEVAVIRRFLPNVSNT